MNANLFLRTTQPTYNVVCIHTYAFHMLSIQIRAHRSFFYLDGSIYEESYHRTSLWYLCLSYLQECVLLQPVYCSLSLHHSANQERVARIYHQLGFCFCMNHLRTLSLTDLFFLHDLEDRV